MKGDDYIEKGIMNTDNTLKERRGATMEKKRELKITFTKGGNGSINPKVSVPKKFLDALEITPESREVIMELDEERKAIIITKKPE